MVERTGRRSWKNLKVWLQRVHQGVVCNATEGLQEEFRGGEADVLYGLLNMAEKLRDKPWAMVEQLIIQFEGALAGLEFEWYEHLY